MLECYFDPVLTAVYVLRCLGRQPIRINIMLVCEVESLEAIVTWVEGMTYIVK